MKRFFDEPRLHIARPFTHTPLQHPNTSIRVLNLAASSGGRLRFSMKQLNIADPPEKRPRFKALSYTWGTEKADKAISIDDKLFYIRPNLHAFLDKLNTAPWFNRNDLLWIDAVCIDQKNVKERNQQLRLMSCIYSSAQVVLIWLGELDVWLDPDESTNDETVTGTAGSYIAARPYWSRLWPCQEVILANQVEMIIGNQQHSFEMFENKVYGSRSDAARSLYIWRYLNRGATSKPRLIQAVEVFGHLECSDARDKLLAILSLISEGDTFPIDYNDTIEAVFWKALEHFNGKYGSYRYDDSVAAGLLLKRTFKLSDVPEVPSLHQLSNSRSLKKSAGFETLQKSPNIHQQVSPETQLSGMTNSPTTRHLYPIVINRLADDAVEYFKNFPRIKMCRCTSCRLIADFRTCIISSKPGRSTGYWVFRVPSIDAGILIFASPSRKNGATNVWQCIGFGDIESGSRGKMRLNLWPPPGGKGAASLIDSSDENARLRRDTLESQGSTVMKVGAKVLLDLLRYDRNPTHHGAKWETYENPDFKD